MMPYGITGKERVNKNKDKRYETNHFGNFVILSDNLRGDLKYTTDLILDFNE